MFSDFVYMPFGLKGYNIDVLKCYRKGDVIFMILRLPFKFGLEKVSGIFFSDGIWCSSINRRC